MKRLLAWLGFLFSPSAVGIYITLLVAFGAFRFYTHRADGENESAIEKLIQIAHQKSIDFRLQARGPRFGAPDVALLTVDERSVETAGRWPWPREITAKALDKAVEFGAKVIAFDMVFSEPSARTAQELFASLKSDNALMPKALPKWEEEIKKLDSDQLFSQIIAKNADKLVVGSFFEFALDPMTYATYPNICHNFLFEQSNAFKQWDKSAVVLAASDPFDIYIPDLLVEAFKQHLTTIEEQVKSARPAPRNSTEAIELRTAIQQAKINYCFNFLNPEKDELYAILSQNWEAIRAEDEELRTPTYEDWVDEIKAKSMRNRVLVADGWTMNTEQISAGAKHIGYFNAQLDADGTIRRSRLVARTGFHYMPSIGLKAYLVANNYNAEIILRQDPKDPGSKVIDYVRITNNEDGSEVFQVPVDDEGNLTINYAGDRNMFAYASMGDLLIDDPEIQIEQQERDPATGKFRRKVWKERKDVFFKDKILVLGATAIGIFDLRVTPFDENFPGAETHVNVIDNLVRRDFLKTHPDEEIKMLLTLVVLGTILSFALAHLGALPGMVMAIIGLAGTVVVDRYFLFANGIVVAIIFPLVLVVSIYVGLTFYKYLTEERKKRELRSTFSKYVSPAIVDEILKDPSNLELGGRKERITVFFSDVRGFTTISEKLDPGALSDLLNSYLTPMTDLVFQHRGTLDKYMGDAIMGFFGAPISYKDHAARACRCALSHIAKLTELQEVYRSKGLPAIDVGIGLNTGECSVGNMGSQTVRNYTVMGDAVNLASRLEGINKQYGTRIIISEFTHRDVAKDFICREIDWVKVKGKAQPVKIFELIAEGQVQGATLELLKNFEEGYQFYHARKFDKAQELFTRALNINPSDTPSELYLERCRAFIAQPPPEDWDGVFTMTSK